MAIVTERMSMREWALERQRQNGQPKIEAWFFRHPDLWEETKAEFRFGTPAPVIRAYLNQLFPKTSDDPFTFDPSTITRLRQRHDA